MTPEKLAYSRGFYDALDHIAGFINALDSGEMTAKDVRSAIYSECLTARPKIGEEHDPRG